MAKGRKQKPVSLKLVTGNPGKRELKGKAAAEALAPDLKPTPPKWFPEEAKEFWKPIVKTLRAMRVAKESDKPALGLLCMALQDVKAAHAEIEKEGYTVPTAEGEKTNPHYQVKSKAMLIAIRLMAEFGMTPTSRARVLGMAAPAAADPLDEFLDRRENEAG